MGGLTTNTTTTSSTDKKGKRRQRGTRSDNNSSIGRSNNGRVFLKAFVLGATTCLLLVVASLYFMRVDRIQLTVVYKTNDNDGIKEKKEEETTSSSTTTTTNNNMNMNNPAAVAKKAAVPQETTKQQQSLPVVPALLLVLPPDSSYPYCDRNSTQPHCCTEEHCQLIRLSTIYSACCRHGLGSSNRVVPNQQNRPRQRPPPRKRPRPPQGEEQQFPDDHSSLPPPRGDRIRQRDRDRRYHERKRHDDRLPPHRRRPPQNHYAQNRTYHVEGDEAGQRRRQLQLGLLFGSRPNQQQPSTERRPPKKPLKPQHYLPGPKLFPLLITATPRSGTVFTQRLLRQLNVDVTDDWHTPWNDGMVSWMHIMNDGRHFSSPARLKGSKFVAVWHQVRDPLKSLTSMAFTEPLDESTSHSREYVRFLNRHITLPTKNHALAVLKKRPQERQGSSGSSPMTMEIEEPTTTTTTITTNRHNNQTKILTLLEEQFLVVRGLEFYVQWHKFILSLNIPRFQLEDLADRHNMTLLDTIFQSIGRPPPNHSMAMDIIAQDRRRKRQRQRRRQLLRQQQRQLHANHREHRTTLEWHELCQASLLKTQEFLQLSHELGYYLDMQSVC